MNLALQLHHSTSETDLPRERDLRRWLLLALLAEGRERVSLGLAFVDEEEGRRLHARHLGGNRASNVLAFPAVPPAPPEFLGDLVLCPAVVRREARRQHKALDAHYAHLTLHGLLHLLGYRHETEYSRRRMERRERVLLAALGYPDPYRLRASRSSRG